MNQLSILAERLEGRPIEERFSDTFLMDWEGWHTPQKECIAREGIVMETKMDKIMELFLRITTHVAMPPHPCTPAITGGNVAVHGTAAKWANATTASWKSPGYFPADKHPETFEKSYFCSCLASTHCCRKARVSHGSCVRSASTSKCLSYRKVIGYYVINAFAWAGRYNTRPRDYHLPGWMLGIPVLLKCLQTPAFRNQI